MKSENTSQKRGQEDYEGILGKVFYMFKSYGFWRNQTEFYMALGMGEGLAESYKNGKYNTKTMVFDYFNADTYDYIIDGLALSLEKRINLSEDDTAKYNETLIEILEQENHYLKQSLTHLNANDIKQMSDSVLFTYDKTYVERLSNYIRIYHGSVNFTHNLYLLLVLALTKKLPKELFFGSIYESQLHEFNEKVTKLYGISSKPATRAILELADHKNVIAQYERAEKYYYGDTISNIPRDIPKAYELYKQVAGLDRYSDLPDKKNAESIHPLALWSLGFILFNYHRKNSELKDCPPIADIDYWLSSKGELFVIEKVIQYNIFSYDLIENAPSANILGQIALLTDKDLPGIDEIKEKYQLKSSAEYFQSAADKGYVYAINNEAIQFANKAFEYTDEKEKYALKFAETLDKSAQKYEPWACVELGHFFRTGTIERRRTDSMQRTGETEVFPSFIDAEKARAYYLRASEFMLDKNSGWGCYNLLCFYTDWVITNGKVDELVNKIKQTEDSVLIKKADDLLQERHAIFYQEALPILPSPEINSRRF